MSCDEQPDAPVHGECAAEIKRLEAENEALKADLAAEQDEVILKSVCLKGMRKMNETLAAQIEALKLDAARYRWLRDNPWNTPLIGIIRLHLNSKWDAAIDAAMKGTEK